MRVTTPAGHSLHVRVRGEGCPDVVLLHGWLVSGEVWHPVLERWPERGAGRLLAVDLRGAGWSHRPPTGYSVAEYAADIGGLLDALGLAGPVLVGHSLGGVIAQRLAVDRPGAFARLVLVCPVPASGQPFDAPTLAYLHAQCGDHDGVRALISSTLAGAVDEDALARLLVAASATVEAARHEGLDSFRTADFGDRLQELAVPSAIVVGERDPVLPPAFVQETVAARIPHATFTILTGCGHYPHLEAPDQLTHVLLAEVAAARS